MNIKENLCVNAMRKIGMLIIAASKLGMDCSGYGDAGENPHSGHVYVWLEDYSFCLYIGLYSDTVYASWQDCSDGHECEIDVENMTIDELHAWVKQCEAGEITE